MVQRNAAIWHFGYVDFGHLIIREAYFIAFPDGPWYVDTIINGDNGTGAYYLQDEHVFTQFDNTADPDQHWFGYTINNQHVTAMGFVEVDVSGTSSWLGDNIDKLHAFSQPGLSYVETKPGEVTGPRDPSEICQFTSGCENGGSFSGGGDSSGDFE